MGNVKNPFTTRGPVDGPEHRDPKKVFEGIATLSHKLLCDAMVAKQRPGTTKLFGCRPATGEPPLEHEFLDRFDAMIERFSSNTPLAEQTSRATGEGVVFDRLHVTTSDSSTSICHPCREECALSPCMRRRRPSPRAASRRL